MRKRIERQPSLILCRMVTQAVRHQPVGQLVDGHAQDNGTQRDDERLQVEVFNK